MNDHSEPPFVHRVQLQGSVLYIELDDGRELSLGKAGVQKLTQTLVETLIMLSGGGSEVIISALFEKTTHQAIWKWQNMDEVVLDKHIRPHTQDSRYRHQTQSGRNQFTCEYNNVTMTVFSPINLNP